VDDVDHMSGFSNNCGPKTMSCACSKKESKICLLLWSVLVEH